MTGASLGSDESSVPQTPPKEQLPAQSPEPVKQDDFNYDREKLDEEIQRQRIAAGELGGFTKIGTEVLPPQVELSVSNRLDVPQNTGNMTIRPQRIVLSTTGIDEQAELAASMVPGLTETQAKVLFKEAFNPNKPVEVVLGGSRVRSYFGEGTFRQDSDLDIGFNAKMKNSQVDRILDAFDAEGPLQSERGIRIFSGNNPPSGPIVSPQEFFQRSGIRGPFPPGRAGEPFGPSGFISFHPDGTVTIVPPRGGL